MASLAQLFVDFQTRGWAKTLVEIRAIEREGRRFDQASQQIAGTVSSLRTVGVALGAAFAGAAAGMLSFAAAADPVGFTRFKVQFQLISLEIGRVFLPILHKVTDALSAVAGWLRNLTPVQIRAARVFAIMGTAVLGLVGVIATFGAAMLGLIPVVATTVASINAILTAGTGGLWALGIAIGAVVTSVMAMGAAFLAGVAGLIVMGQQGETVGQKLQRAWDKIWNAVGPIILKIGEGWYRLWAIAKEVFSSLAQIFMEFISSLGDMGNAWFWVQGAVEVWVDAVIEAVKTAGQYFVAFIEIVKQFALAFVDIMQMPQNMIQQLIQDLRALMAAFAQVDWKHPIESAKRVNDALADLAAGQLKVMTQPLANFDLGAITDKVKDFRERAEGADRKAKKEFNNPKTTKDERPEGFARQPQIMDVAEVWKHAQQAQQNDPRLELERRRLELQAENNRSLLQNNDYLKQILNQVSKGGMK